MSKLTQEIEILEWKARGFDKIRESAESLFGPSTDLTPFHTHVCDWLHELVERRKERAAYAVANLKNIEAFVTLKNGTHVKQSELDALKPDAQRHLQSIAEAISENVHKIVETMTCPHCQQTMDSCLDAEGIQQWASYHVAGRCK